MYNFEAQLRGLRELLRENFSLTTGIGKRLFDYAVNLESLFNSSEEKHHKTIKYLEGIANAPSPHESKYNELVEAVRWIYYAARWIPDRSVDGKEGNMWARLRDAAGFEKGKSPKPLEFINDGFRKSGWYAIQIEDENRKLKHEVSLIDGRIKELELLLKDKQQQESSLREISLLNKQQAATIKELQGANTAHQISASLQKELINNQSIKIADLSKASDLDAKTMKYLRDEMERYQAALSEERGKLRKLKEVLNG